MIWVAWKNGSRYSSHNARYLFSEKVFVKNELMFCPGIQ